MTVPRIAGNLESYPFLDLSTNTGVAEITLETNQWNLAELSDLGSNRVDFTEINVNGNDTVTKLAAWYEDSVTNVEFKNASKLDQLGIAGKGITDITLSNLPALEELAINKQDCSLINLTIDETIKNAIKNFNAGFCDVKSVFGSNFSYSMFPNLEELNDLYSTLSIEDVSGLTKATTLQCVVEGDTLDLTPFNQLNTVFFNAGNINTLEVGDNTTIETLLTAGSFGTVNLGNCPNLTDLQIGKEQTSINLSQVPNLEGLRTEEWSKLQTLDLSKTPKLRGIQLDGCELTTLDVTNNTALEHLYVTGKQLETINFGGSSYNSLTDLKIINPLTPQEANDRINDRNPTIAGGITSLDVSKLQNLEKLEIKDSDLTSLDISANTQLTELIAEGDFTSIDVSATELVILRLKGNFTSLDLSANTKLERLEVTDNGGITELDLSANTALGGEVDLRGLTGLTTVKIASGQSTTNWALPSGASIVTI